VQSSPSSSALAFRASSRTSPSPAHRPFDLRFQSRLSSSSFSSPRPSSPLLLHTHSRNSSFASQLPLSGTPDLEPDAPQAPWEVVRWTKLRKIAGQSFSEIGRRNFGRPTCISVSTAIVLGTSKGIVLVFDYQQNLKTIIGPGTKGLFSHFLIFCSSWYAMIYQI
jgi:vacuolar protein sorting-associated protein 8